MQDWKEAKWHFVKTPRNRYIGIEIDGILHIVDLMPFFMGLLSLPQIHGWQQFPLYCPKTEEVETEMRKLRLYQWKLRTIEKKVAGMSILFFGLSFTLRKRLYPFFAPLFDKLSIPGIFGIFSLLLSLFAMHCLFSTLLGSPLREELMNYTLSSTKISIRYRQTGKMRRAAYVFLVFLLLSLPLTYSGLLPGIIVGPCLGMYPIITHTIPNKANIQYLLRQHPQKIESE